ncbi:MAG: serine/threonine-protein kinase [Isosphaeraceae bacterium]
MPPSEKSRAASEAGPPELVHAIELAGILPDRALEDVRAKVLGGKYPLDPADLARVLIRDGLITDYQAKKLLAGKTNSLKVDKYVVLDRIGSGAMGRVYKAQHSLMGRVVALKLIAPEIAANNRVISRFQREMRMVGRLDHPNVVRAYDADRLNQLLYIVMEFVQGHSLGHRLRTRGTLSPAEAADYAGQAALGLAHAHEQGIVHRDVKPSNLLLGPDEAIKVLDLGLGVLLEADQHTSFATADGIAVGTIDYMSPEQASGKEVDGRSDLFSLGCTMYHLLTGRLPFPGESPIDRLGKRLSGRPTPILEHRPDVPIRLVKVLDKLMATAPNDRFQDAGEAAEVLLALVKKRPYGPGRACIIPIASAPPPAAPPPPPAPPPEPEIVRVEPEYPGWFRPLARLAETRPPIALLALAGAGVAAALAGLIVGALF